MSDVGCYFHFRFQICDFRCRGFGTLPPTKVGVETTQPPHYFLISSIHHIINSSIHHFISSSFLIPHPSSISSFSFCFLSTKGFINSAFCNRLYHCTIFLICDVYTLSSSKSGSTSRKYFSKFALLSL